MIWLRHDKERITDITEFATGNDEDKPPTSLPTSLAEAIARRKDVSYTKNVAVCFVCIIPPFLSSDWLLPLAV